MHLRISQQWETSGSGGSQVHYFTVMIGDYFEKVDVILSSRTKSGVVASTGPMNNSRDIWTRERPGLASTTTTKRRNYGLFRNHQTMVSSSYDHQTQEL